jgi:hypothetical protein
MNDQRFARIQAMLALRQHRLNSGDAGAAPASPEFGQNVDRSCTNYGYGEL